MNDAPQTMSLDLGTIKFNIPKPTKKKKDPKSWLGGTINVPRSPEEIFMLSNLPPACHSPHIKIDYFLNANIKYDGCTCCLEKSDIKIPMSIIPITNPATYGFQEPPDYQPFMLGHF